MMEKRKAVPSRDEIQSPNPSLDMLKRVLVVAELVAKSQKPLLVSENSQAQDAKKTQAS
jgi:hypothetical protein